MWHLKTRRIKHTEKDKKKQEDALIIEKTINLELNGHHHHCFSSSGGDEIALSLGHLYLEYGDLKLDGLKSRYDQGTVSITSPGIALHETPLPPLDSSPISFNKIVIFQLTAYLQENAFLFKHTAISESAAIANHQEILFFFRRYLSSQCHQKGLWEILTRGTHTPLSPLYSSYIRKSRSCPCGNGSYYGYPSYCF